MTKQEQIEEMGKVMPEKIKDPLDNSRYIIFGKSLRREIARIYYNAGYRKLPKDSVVLSKEEHEILVKTALKATDFLKACISSGIMVEPVSTKEQVRQAVKEFAEELKAKTMCIQEYADGTRILETSNKLIDQSVKIFLTNY